MQSNPTWSAAWNIQRSWAKFVNTAREWRNVPIKNRDTMLLMFFGFVFLMLKLCPVHHPQLWLVCKADFITAISVRKCLSFCILPLLALSSCKLLALTGSEWPSKSLRQVFYWIKAATRFRLRRAGAINPCNGGTSRAVLQVNIDFFLLWGPLKFVLWKVIAQVG